MRCAELQNSAKGGTRQGALLTAKDKIRTGSGNEKQKEKGARHKES